MSKLSVLRTLNIVTLLVVPLFGCGTVGGPELRVSASVQRNVLGVPPKAQKANAKLNRAQEQAETARANAKGEEEAERTKEELRQAEAQEAKAELKRAQEQAETAKADAESARNEAQQSSNALNATTAASEENSAQSPVAEEATNSINAKAEAAKRSVQKSVEEPAQYQTLAERQRATVLISIAGVVLLLLTVGSYLFFRRKKSGNVLPRPTDAADRASVEVAQAARRVAKEAAATKTVAEMTEAAKALADEAVAEESLARKAAEEKAQ
jgi:hypothetical protein